MTVQEAIKERHMVRKYLDKPIPDEVSAKLRERLDEDNRASGLKLTLVTGSADGLGSMAKLISKNVKNYIILAGPDKPNLDEMLGYWGADAMLFAQTIGLNSWWVGGMFNAKGAAKHFPENGLHINGVIANLLKKGEDFDNLPETYVVFITENDVMGKGKPLYQIERCILETGERFEDGTHILYVNGAYRDESPIGKLMHDFSCTNPSDMNYGVLADRVRFFKESKEGIAVMCKAMEDMRNESLQEGMKEGMKAAALRMLKAGKYALEEIASISGLSLDEVKKLNADKTA